MPLDPINPPDDFDLQMDRWADVAALALAKWEAEDAAYRPTPRAHMRRLLRYLFDLGYIGREGARYVLPSLDEHFAGRVFHRNREVN